MADLFDSAPAKAVPVYGSLTPSDEYALYHRDRATWVLYVAPRHVELLTTGGDAWIDWSWPLMGSDLQRAVWNGLDDHAKARIRAVRKQGVTTDG